MSNTNFSTSYSPKTERAIAKYGKDACIAAYRMNVKEGEGGTYIAENLGIHINSTSAAISAGEEIAAVAVSATKEKREVKIKFAFGQYRVEYVTRRPRGRTMAAQFDKQIRSKEQVIEWVESQPNLVLVGVTSH